MNQEIISSHFEETQYIAKKFAKQLNPGDTIVLYGNLGAGKTTFVQGLAKGLGIEKRIISPTFVIIRRYKICMREAFQLRSSLSGQVSVLQENLYPKGTSFFEASLPRSGLKHEEKEKCSHEIEKDPNNKEVYYFYHVDLYRLSGEQDIEGTGLLEILSEKNAITAIEWPEKMGSLLPKNRLEVKLEQLDGDKRRIIIERMSNSS